MVTSYIKACQVYIHAYAPAHTRWNTYTHAQYVLLQLSTNLSGSIVIEHLLYVFNKFIDHVQYQQFPVL